MAHATSVSVIAAHLHAQLVAMTAPMELAALLPPVAMATLIAGQYTPLPIAK